MLQGKLYYLYLNIIIHVTFNEIVEHTKKSPSTVSWHLKRLKDAGIVSLRYGHQNQQLYTATDEGLVADVTIQIQRELCG